LGKLYLKNKRILDDDTVCQLDEVRYKWFSYVNVIKTVLFVPKKLSK